MDNQYGSFSITWRPSFMILCVGILASFVNYLFRLRRQNPRNLSLPPGPPRLPFYGSVLDKAKAGSAWELYTDMARTYGDIYYITSPRSSVLVLNTVAAINDLVERRSSIYSDRLSLPALDMANAGWNFGLIPYGPWWRAHRRAFHQLMHPKVVPQYRPIIQYHTMNYLRRLLKDPEAFFDHTQVLFGEIIMQLAYGTKDSDSVKDFTIMAEQQVQGVTGAAVPGALLVNTLPFLRFVPTWLPGTGWKKHLLHLAHMTDRMTNKTFDDARERIKAGVQEETPSLVAQLLERLPPSDHPDAAEQEVIAKHVAGVAYIGGADTTIGSASSLILALAKYPAAQRKAQEEIDNIVGPGRLPDFDDFAKLPYLRALIKEVIRFWPVAPLGVPHATSDDDVYRDFFIPRGTSVITNTWAIFRDPENYVDPFEFRPERFLKDGQINSDVLDPESCLFGYGRRVCPGRYFSQETLGLMAASLLAVFNVEPAKDNLGKPIPLEYVPNGPMIVKPERFQCNITPRSAAHVGLLAEAMGTSHM